MRIVADPCDETDADFGEHLVDQSDDKCDRVGRYESCDLRVLIVLADLKVLFAILGVSGLALL